MSESTTVAEVTRRLDELRTLLADRKFGSFTWHREIQIKCAALIEWWWTEYPQTPVKTSVAINGGSAIPSTQAAERDEAPNQKAGGDR